MEAVCPQHAKTSSRIESWGFFRSDLGNNPVIHLSRVRYNPTISTVVSSQHRDIKGGIHEIAYDQLSAGQAGK